MGWKEGWMEDEEDRMGVGRGRLVVGGGGERGCAGGGRGAVCAEEGSAAGVGVVVGGERLDASCGR